ncbi:hypothetical protein [Streptosporangium sp. NPDC023615]|uniref:hypothetical protein n=1 Tax=Streptosporangium sp. NPDC023615 TaxID=3154794 RepID=UPI00344ADFF9
MNTRDPQEEFVHLVRLGWDLRKLGVGASLVLPRAGQPILEVMSGSQTRVRITVVRRDRGWVFVWRPWWARVWRPGEAVWAEADNAADVIVSAAIA